MYGSRAGMKKSAKILLFLLFLMHMNGRIAAQENLIFSHPAGFYDEAFQLTISSGIPDAVIKYTLDGTNPFYSNNVFSQDSSTQLLVDPAIGTIRDRSPGFIVTACATVADTLVSEIMTQTYLFADQVTTLSPDNQVPGPDWLVPGMSSQAINYGMDPEVYNNTAYKDHMFNALTSIPTMSLVMDLGDLFDPDSGIYVNALKHGPEWERNASLELIYPDEREGFRINCGIRIRGGWSRNYECPKRAFRFFFRNEYGEGKLRYPLFGEEGTDEFDKIDLRTAMNYSWSFAGDSRNTFLRDVFSRDTQRDMDQPYTRSRYYHLYINGSYWGLYQTQERSEASFGEQYFGGLREDYDVIKVDVGENFNLYHVEATDGTLDAWRRLWDAAQAGFEDDEDYFRVQGFNMDGTLNPSYEKLLDVDNLIDYMLITFFVGDFDGPISNFRGNYSPNNFYALYNRVNPNGFKFLRHDAEHTLFIHEWGNDRTGPFPAGNNFEDSNPQWIHQKLSENANYRLRFADRAYKHLFLDGALTLDKIHERLTARRNTIEYAIIAESARWGDSKSFTPYTYADWNNAVNYIFTEFLPNRKNIVIGQLINKGLLPGVSVPLFSEHGGKVDKGFDVSFLSHAGEIYYTVDGSDPYSPFDLENSAFSRNLIVEESSKKVYVPQSTFNVNWQSPEFDDSGWLSCTGAPGGVGYETGAGYESLITLSTQAYMYESGANPNTSCYVRIPFEVSDVDLNEFNFLTLSMLYDDGFVAYINGQMVASVNAPVGAGWNSSAIENHEAESYVDFDISAHLNKLVPGRNVLAVHGMNVSLSSSDFLILPKLTAGREAVTGGSIAASAELYTAPFPVNETTKISARALMGTQWSPLTEALFIIPEDLSDLRITELHYHPLDQDTINDREFEFIELKNIGANEINLTASSFVRGIDFAFPSGSVLPPGEFIVLASDSNYFNLRYGFKPYGEYDGQLNNGGETISFTDAAGDTAISFLYSDDPPWPTGADGGGYSLVSRSLNGSGSPGNADYWILSGIVHGSPGMDDIVSDINDENINHPVRFELSQNYPNPFNPSTVIKYSIPAVETGHAPSLHIRLTVYDVLGREVATLVNKQQRPGEYSVNWNASSVSSGVYFYTLTAGSFTETKKMLLIR